MDLFWVVAVEGAGRPSQSIGRNLGYLVTNTITPAKPGPRREVPEGTAGAGDDLIASVTASVCRYWPISLRGRYLRVVTLTSWADAEAQVDSLCKVVSGCE